MEPVASPRARIAVNLEEGYLEVGIKANQLQRYAEEVLRCAVGVVQYSHQFPDVDYSHGWHRIREFFHDSGYLHPQFIWIVGKYFCPDRVNRDIFHLAMILMDYRWEYDCAPRYDGVRVFNNSVFFQVA